MIRYIFTLSVLQLLLFASCGNQGDTSKKDLLVSKQMVDSSIAEDTDIQEIVAPYKIKLENELSGPIGYSKNGLSNPSPKGESPLGNFVADAIHTISELQNESAIDFALINAYGGLRASLPVGVINKKQIFELMPFENEVVVLTLTVTEVQKVFDISAKSMTNAMSNSTYTIINNKAKDILIGGMPLNEKKTYQLALSDYLANGGGGFHVLKRLPRKTLNYKVRDMIIDYITIENEKNHSIDAVLEGRVKKSSGVL